MEKIIMDKVFGMFLAQTDRVPEARTDACAGHLHTRPSLEERTSFFEGGRRNLSGTPT